MKTRKEVMFLLLVIILLGIGCIFFFSQKREEQKSQTSMKEEIAAAGIPVTSYVVERVLENLLWQDQGCFGAVYNSLCSGVCVICPCRCGRYGHSRGYSLRA